LPWSTWAMMATLRMSLRRVPPTADREWEAVGSLAKDMGNPVLEGLLAGKLVGGKTGGGKKDWRRTEDSQRERDQSKKGEVTQKRGSHETKGCVGQSRSQGQSPTAGLNTGKEQPWEPGIIQQRRSVA